MEKITILLALLMCISTCNCYVARLLETRLSENQRDGFSIAYDNDDTVYLLGGYGNAGNTANILKFSVSSETFSNFSHPLPSTFVRSVAQFDPVENAIWLCGEPDFELSVYRIVKIPLGTSTAPSIQDDFYFSNNAIAFWGKEHLYLSRSQSSPILRYNRNDGSIVNTTTRYPLNRNPSMAWNSDESFAYFFGGAWSTWVTNDILRFDPNLLEEGTGFIIGLNETTSMKTFQSHAVKDENYAYIFGGHDDTSNLATIDRFDFDSYEVATLPLEGMPYTHLGGGASIYVKKTNSIYIFGRYGSTIYTEIVVINLD